VLDRPLSVQICVLSITATLYGVNEGGIALLLTK
jgi:hypothetical protein